LPPGNAKNSNVLNQMDSVSGRGFLLEAITTNSAAFKHRCATEAGQGVLPIGSGKEFKCAVWFSTLEFFEIEDASLKQDWAFLLEATAQNSAVFKNVNVSLKEDEGFASTQCLQAIGTNSNLLNQIGDTPLKQQGLLCGDARLCIASW